MSSGVRGCLAYLEWVGRTFGKGPAASRRDALRSAMAAIREHENVISLELLRGLSAVKGLRIRGITDEARMACRVPTYSFTLEGHHPRRICEALDAAGIAAWDGNYYALEVTRRLGLEGTGGMVRVGAAHYTTAAEVDRLLEVIDSIAAARAPGRSRATASS